MLNLLLTALLTAAAPIIPVPVEYSRNGVGAYKPELLQKPRILQGSRSGNTFRSKVASLPAFAREEAYEIVLNGCGATIRALTPEGVFRACQTLRKLELTDTARLCCTISGIIWM